MINIINVFAQLLIWVLIARAILSWFANPSFSNSNQMAFLMKLYAFLCQVTEPLVRPMRRLLSRFNTGPMDFSLFATMLLIIAIQRILIRILLLVA
ncbi:MAG: YggT family protein [Clostridiales Family XIII bacterium]|nr:YggT family protein [Clostridiales Family XIII bacterium]